jgi:predicted transcriptional regulator
MIEFMTDKKRRSNIEISADILKVALHGAKKSHIVYRANLNFEVVKTCNVSVKPV